ncbi:Sulfate/thiosulfate import ATP-binding protein CysA [Nocardia farcinica]|uniref:Sulfate/thiosulfate import ATP-binding protein CysA n=1 Tax=Nocardia farcinica TaxID=37329 RepID=A0A449GIG6_NOCFR|nr:ABC transporter ATP-binding protein [Nocardia farcinica]VFA92389.1 Sulfate/thiosulfate import ATP-binding protein CysA [Nocardia farcinica]
MTAKPPAITVRALAKRYESGIGVEDVSFTVAPGTVTALVGPSGSGKTTVLRVLLGLVEPTAGTATVHGAGSVGAVLTPRGLHPGRAAREHLAVYAAAAGVGRDRVADVLETVGLSDVARVRAGDLSPGRQTRLALATALLTDPRVLLLDDPTDGLDHTERGWLHDFLRRHARRGGSAVVTGASLAAVVSTADQLVVLSEGSPVYQGTPAALRRSNPDRLVVAAGVPVALATALAARGHTDAVIRPDGRLAVAEATEAQIRDAARAAGVRIDSIVADPIHPDRVLASLTRPRVRPPTPSTFVPPPPQPTPYGIPR